MKDRFVRGFIAGIIAWAPTFVLNWGAYYFHLATLRWSDFTGILLYGHKPGNFLENLFALAGVIFFLAILGVGFAYLVTAISSSHCVFKGLVYGVTLWFAFYVVTLLFKVPYLTKIPFKTAFFNSLGASIWGISLGLAFIWIDNRTKYKKIS